MRSAVRRFSRRTILYLAVVAIALWVLAPYAWLIISSISTKIDLLTVPLKWIPAHPTLENYRSLFTDGRSALSQGMSFFSQSMLNSVAITFASMGVCMFFGIFTAYAVARLSFPGRKFSLLLLMGSYMMPPIAIVVPGYVILKSLGLLDTRVGLMLVDVTFILPLVVWIMRGFFLSIPLELEEAARIDGSSRLGALLRIILPLSAPGLVSAAVFCFIASWNEYLYAFLYTSMKARTLPVLIGEFTTKVGTDYLRMAAAGVVASLPPVVLALVFQRFLIRGLTEGAVKG
ncbi:MAG TPA: carbohydrate ABC transporter permease [Spirochaetia bacterium]|nr:carbohydrate ABC transporter permease [Spirochaetia bacterium]